MMEALSGYDSQERSFMCENYPYGRTVRCRIRYWLEKDEKKGFRFCSQTENPRTLQWNNPKKSTYCLLAGAMYRDDKGHVVWSGMTQYDEAETVLEFITRFPGCDVSQLVPWCRLKVRYTQGMIDKKIQFTINGVVKPWSEADTERHREELEVWNKCVSMMTGKV